MIPILYDIYETSFTNLGFGCLSDATSCLVTEEKNGLFELSMTYPINGIHYSEIKLNRIIYAKPSDDQDPQPFDIYKISKPINGHVTISAEHINYRCRYIPVKPFTVEKTVGTNVIDEIISRLNPDSGASQILENVQDPFKIYIHGDTWSEKEDTYSFSSPRSLKECLGGNEQSFLNLYGGEIKYDKFDIHIYQERGNHKSEVRIAYSKNLTDLTHSEDATDQITAIFPYYSNTDGTIAKSYRIVTIPTAETVGYKKIASIDFRNEIDHVPENDEEWDTIVNSYIEKNKLGTPSVNLKVSFIPLWQTEEYKNVVSLERVSLCDEITVEFKELGVESRAQVIKTEYDVLLERYKSITLGEDDKSLDKTIVNIAPSTRKETDKAIRKSESKLENALDEQRKLLTGANGGYIVNVYNKETGLPEEIVVGDRPSIDEMENCIRINKAGIWFSQNGYNESAFRSAWSINGQFTADWITAGKMSGDRIEANTIKSGDLSVGSSTPTYKNIGESEKAPTFVENAYYNHTSGLYMHQLKFLYKSNSLTTGTIIVETKSTSNVPYTMDTIPANLSTSILYSDNDGDLIPFLEEQGKSGYAFSFNFDSPSMGNHGFVQGTSSTLYVDMLEYKKWNESVYGTEQEESRYWLFAGDDVSTISEENYILLETEPQDWTNNYTSYFYKDDEYALGSYIRIGVDKKTGKPVIRLAAGDSTIQLVETNDRLSFINVSDPNNPVELAYISGTEFNAPKFKLGGYTIDQSNGIIFKWVGN